MELSYRVGVTPTNEEVDVDEGIFFLDSRFGSCVFSVPSPASRQPMSEIKPYLVKLALELDPMPNGMQSGLFAVRFFFLLFFFFKKKI